MLPYDLASERDLLIEKVKRGELTPLQAEDEVSRLGMDSLAFSPNPADFDPMTEVNWSFPMSLGWIIWRTPDAVRELWDRYRMEFRFWVAKTWQVPGGPVFDGYWLERKNRAGFLEIDIMCAKAKPTATGVKNCISAFHLLSRAAQCGEWKATGIRGGSRLEILPHEWIDFRPCEQFSGPVGVVTTGLEVSGYDDCRFPVAGLTRSFPLSSESRQSEQKPRNARPEKINTGYQSKKILEAINIAQKDTRRDALRRLRPVEFRDKLSKIMKNQMGLTDADIPEESTFRRALKDLTPEPRRGKSGKSR